MSDFPEPWLAVVGEAAQRLADELEAEVSPGHELHGEDVTPIARCGGCDDVVFRLGDESFAIVHLTWSGNEDRPPWPSTDRFGGFIAIEMAMDQHEH